MNITDELIEKFAINSDSELCDNSSYLKATSLLFEFSQDLLPKKRNELEDISQRLTSAVLNAGVKVGLRLGARIAVGLIDSDK